MAEQGGQRLFFSYCPTVIVRIRHGGTEELCLFGWWTRGAAGNGWGIVGVVFLLNYKGRHRIGHTASLKIRVGHDRAISARVDQ